MNRKFPTFIAATSGTDMTTWRVCEKRYAHLLILPALIDSLQQQNVRITYRPIILIYMFKYDGIYIGDESKRLNGNFFV